MAFDWDLVKVVSDSGISVFRLGWVDVEGLFHIDTSSVLWTMWCCSTVENKAALIATG
jgi:hypothetical protein